MHILKYHICRFQFSLYHVIQLIIKQSEKITHEQTGLDLNYNLTGVFEKQPTRDMLMYLKTMNACREKKALTHELETLLTEAHKMYYRKWC